ncbi:hypothetical protein THRCLA_05862 [Thraustotheca clavata]|uniref:HTH CENPB-type domain-containing protein n=1 Tax=Thraustotheca clavata TaxID=74557 RepID=A0A1V9ZRZ8_9STRA|nr:hypothetical protein THRCLA_05862 [Thraustotheca clavata]
MNLDEPPQPNEGDKKRGKGTRLTDEQRMEILDSILHFQSSEATSCTRVPTKRLAEEYGVTPAAIRKLYKEKEVFLARFANGREGVRNARKRGGDRSKVDFEAELYSWVNNLRNNNVAIVPSHIQQHALNLAKKYPSMDKFQASWGWYYRFCNRYNIARGIHPPTDFQGLTTDTSNALVDEDSLQVLNTSTMQMNQKPNISEEVVLLQAATAGELHTVEMLIQKGINVDCVNECGCTPLILALKSGHFHILKYLLEHSAKPDATDETGVSAALVAVKTNSVNALKCLLEANAKTESTDNNLKTALIIAAELGNLQAVKLLLRFGANIEATDVDDSTALMGAIKHDHDNVVEVLVKKGANRSMVEFASVNKETNLGLQSSDLSHCSREDSPSTLCNPNSNF